MSLRGADTVRRTLLGAALCGAILVPACATADSYFVPDTVETRIVDTQVKRYDNTDKYLILTEDGVFENTDAWYRGKFRSSDLQTQAIKSKGKRVELLKYGWRNGLFSWYENVVGIRPLE